MTIPHFPLLVPDAEASGQVEVHAPYDGQLLARVDTGGQGAVEQALSNAYALFRDRDAWLAPSKRIEILARTAVLMREQAEHYPHWHFDTNKGYPCPLHKTALQGYGPSAIHRRTWVFMDNYVPWPGMRVIRPEQPTLF